MTCLAALALLAPLAACGTSGDDPPTTPTEAATPAATPSPTASPTPAAHTVKPVHIPTHGDGTFKHNTITAKANAGRGEVVTFDVQVESDVPYRADAIARFALKVLLDIRSWTGGGQWRFRLVDRAADADMHIYLVTPDTTDDLCAPVDTAGKVSCRNGDRVVLNALRWAKSVPWFTSHRRYRTMLVNHEVGHYLGHVHQQCPGKGKKAPVMQQQTLGLHGCRTNPWPLPSELKTLT